MLCSKTDSGETIVLSIRDRLSHVPVKDQRVDNSFLNFLHLTTSEEEDTYGFATFPEGMSQS